MMRSTLVSELTRSLYLLRVQATPSNQRYTKAEPTNRIAVVKSISIRSSKGAV